MSTELLRLRIRRARQKAKLSQAALAAVIGVAPGAAAQWELPGGTTPRLVHLTQIATTCAVPFEWLATGRGPSGSGATDVPAVDLSAFAHDDFEEHALELLRQLPARKRELVIRLLEDMAMQLPKLQRDRA